MSSNFKKWFENTVSAPVKQLGRLGVTPNHLTILGLVVSLETGWLFTDWNRNPWYLIYGAVFILLSGLIDAIDGVLARTTGKVTRFGGFFDSVADRFSDVIILSGLILGGLCSVPVGLVALTGSLMVSYIRSRAEMEGVKMAGVGFFERAERMIFIALCSVAAYWWLPALEYGVIILSIMVYVTIVQRIIYFKKEIEKD
ncbi:MAG: archaetidylinositol phosphate synthase [Candidatus Bathyarchaeota archaeon]|nr:archaetidylinositol phosphate synthase [Candidatus Bathyarchaeota archaeon]